VGYLGGDTKGVEHSDSELNGGFERYIHKKFTSDATVLQRVSLLLKIT
jgi:hypothetical protein